MTIAQAIKFATTKLIVNKFHNPYFEAEILLSFVLKKPREFLLAYGEKKLTKSQIANFKLQIAKRLKNSPIAYITGKKKFYGLNFFVNKNTLIPRPETELIVEEVFKLIRHNVQKSIIVDVGVGSGCIIIALAKLLNTKYKIQNTKFIGIDISAKALDIAKQNAETHHVNKKIKFILGNLIEPIINNPKYKRQNTKYIIIANLPYLTSTQIKNSPTIQSEPFLALYGGKDGLKYYCQLFKQLKQLNRSSTENYALCEIDPGQTNRIKQLVRHELPQAKLQIKKDLSGLNRLAVIFLRNY
ncbi:MAG: peptide chain release factor N(5)-glutamine methyltransferase [Patescibacteria group bacterium]